MWSRVLTIALFTALCGLGDLQMTTTIKPGRGKGSSWWGLAKAGEPNNLIPLSPGMVSTYPSTLSNLRKKQRRLVHQHPGVLQAISRGANMATQECQFQFRNRKWNCSTHNFFRGRNLFGNIVETGCRETAFIYALTSAAVTYSIARSCREGTIESCSCDYRNQLRRPLVPNPSTNGVRDWVWSGCSDNIGFSLKFSREFVDAGEKGRNVREKMNLHNNEVGRAFVSQEMRQECKCHGMSGSCTVRTCWMRLPDFREIGNSLKNKFDGASRILHSNMQSDFSTRLARTKRKLNRYKTKFIPHNPQNKPPSRKDLVYMDLSPSFCARNSKMDILGTTGRECNETSVGVDGCDEMCCGRGYRTFQKIVEENCRCNFRWCCEVKCEKCKVLKQIHVCL